MRKNPNKYICIHGHFYQPPRENAWLEQIEVQESAAPFHDWNERINDECYGPNAYARILNEEGKIIDITNNYERISFNMGPTLLSWMELERPETYRLILQADRNSQKKFDGHGSAIAQVYNHLIMPLASKRDKETQIKWGIYDFEQRFQRKSEGMWLAETAVDLETLKCLADQGIEYTILAPNQAKRFKGDSDWQNGINPNFPYKVHLGDNRFITIFFYNGEVSQKIAFGGLLNDGKLFAYNLLAGFSTSEYAPELLHVATDGESYGHHHRQGEMALAYCLHYLEEFSDAQLANYGYFLSRNEVKYEAEIHDNSSWSCAHGVERWKSNCGCHTGGEEYWSQEWRTPLRDGLNWLKMELDKRYEDKMKEFHSDPWGIRNNFIEAVFQYEERDYPSFFKKHFPHLSERLWTNVIRLLEMQRNGMLMFTSCGWFFNDASGIETVQILQYANRAIQLAERGNELGLEDDFLEILAQGKSNIEENGTMKDIYRRSVSPKRMTLSKVGMHYAVNVLFAENPKTLQVFNYNIQTSDLIRHRAGQQVFCIGRAVINSKITLSVKHLSFVVLYLGNHHIIGGTTDDYDELNHKEIVDRLSSKFQNSYITSTIRDIHQYFRNTHFSFFDLMKDEQTKVLKEVIAVNVKDAVNSIDRIAQQNYSLLNLMRRQQLVVPHILWQNLVSKLEHDLRNALTEWSETGKDRELFETLEELIKWDIFPSKNYDFKAANALRKVISSGLFDSEKGVALLERFKKLEMEVELIHLQNLVFTKLKAGEDGAWTTLGEKISLEVQFQEVEV